MNVDRDPEAPPTEPLPPRRGLQLLLPDHHRRLDAKCREMLASAFADDARELVARWCEVEAELIDHIAAEEEVILPSYREHSPEHAKRILDDHARIRELLTPIGVEIELHETRATRLRLLVEALDAHARFEDTTMYPWAQANLPVVAQQLLVTRISRWFRGA